MKKGRQTRACLVCGASYTSYRRSTTTCSYKCGGLAKIARRAPVADRFWSKVDKSGGADACWPWTGPLGRGGYGSVRFQDARDKVASRLAWELTSGPIPDGLFICHRCDNPICCNPMHLFAGTLQENHADMMAKGRNSRGENAGQARLSDADVAAIRAAVPPKGQPARHIYRDFAERLGVTWEHVRHVARGRRRVAV